MIKKHILIVDDDPVMRNSLKEALRRNAAFSVNVAMDGQEALEKIERAPFDLVITDLKMPRAGGIEVVRRIQELGHRTQVVVMTAFATVQTAVEAMKQGAADYLTKPFSIDELELVVAKALEQRRVIEENNYLRQEISSTYNFGSIVGSSEAMRAVYELVAKVASSDATVLIQGESGTGKELIAHAIHQQSKRNSSPFIKVNCAALASSLLESELFGHEKGAFTNAICQKPGRFELADKGTLLLDEISEMEPALQAKFLRVLQEGEFDRVGGTHTIKTDVRIIATTNRTMQEEVAANRFRGDLYYRLNVIPLFLPPLRERKEDIPLLARHFLQKYALKNGKQITGISDPVIEQLNAYDWPGNVRELENTMERAVVLSSAGILDNLFLFPAYAHD